MKIRTQIFSGFLLVLFLTSILAVVTIYYLGNLGTASTKILEENYRSVKASEQIIISLSKVDQILAKICLGQNYNDSSLVLILDREKQLLSNNIGICRQNASDQKEVMLVGELEDEYASYIYYIDDFKTTVDKVGLYFTVLQRLNGVIREHAVQLANINHKDLSEKDDYAQSLYFQSKIYVFLILVLVLMIVGWTVYKVPHEIVKPITKITEKIQRISQGEYQQEIKVDSSSELGDLAVAFNNMSVRLQEFEKLNIEEVQVQKSRMESIIRSMNDGLIILDEQEEIILVNETSSSLIDMEESELIGKKLWELSEKNEVLHELEVSLSNKDFKPATMEESHSFLKINRGDGKHAFFTKEIYKVYSKETATKRFLGHIITLKDITSFKESDEAKSNFIAVVSHELKTPLSALNMSLMLLSNTRFGTLNEEQSKTVKAMKREVQRLVNMVTELLDLTKVERGQISLEKEVIEPAILLEYAIAPVDVKFKQKDVRIDKNIQEGLPALYVDPEKISWVLINLMTNALRYSTEGGKIILEARRLDDMMEFSVKDFGPGISKENLKRVFNKFVQLNTNGKKNKHGLGLGLAISKEVVEAHEGQIFVESELGAWSRFFFRVPIAAETDKEEIKPKELQNVRSMHIT
ncbi:ATP-binding protein [Porifericola rhodea]|uniref:sensor histidine kinase n=1 Tax=Porifericola rhodea TaxID=930972 RepID=UPI002665942E|nr:ATP-binding protein [Porifericola rhodea]WKN30457.1 ATP-binding protein [Porifericola rhodea]